MSRLSIHQSTTSRWSFVDDLVGYQGLGVGAAGLWRPKVAEFGEEKAIELVRELNLSISSLSWAGGFTGEHGESFGDAVEDARSALRLAAAFGASCLVILSGSRVVHIRKHAHRLLQHALGELIGEASELGVTLALQPIHPSFSEKSSFLHSLDDVVGAAQNLGRDCVRIAFDVYHLWQEPSLLERIREVAPLVALVQLCDARGPLRENEERCLPGDGQIPLAAIVKAFDEAGYAGYYEMSVWSERLWRSDYSELLRECRERFYDLVCGPRVPLPSLE